MSTIPIDSAQQYAMTVLVADVEEAQRLAAALDEVRRPDSPLAVIAVPPVRGVAFFADDDRQAKLDRWWAHAIPQESLPVYLVVDEEGIAEWMPGLDGRFVVGVSAPGAAERYKGMRNVTIAGGDGLLDIALAVVEQFSGSGLFRDDAAGRLEKRLRRNPPEAGSRFRRARLRPADETFLRASVAGDHHPIPNLPPPDAAPRTADRAPRISDEAPREELVRALADTLRRLQRIRTTSG
jgi:hypothetical protein